MSGQRLWLRTWARIVGMPIGMTDDERLPIEVYLTDNCLKPGQRVSVHACSKVGGSLHMRVFREGFNVETGKLDDRVYYEQSFDDPGWQPIRFGAWWKGAGWRESGSFCIPEMWDSGRRFLSL